MSFFDDVDEPPTEAGRAPRQSPRRRGTSGSGSGSGSRGGSGSRPPRSGGRPSGAPSQSILVRRAVAIAALIVVIVLIAVGVNSCQNSAQKSALQDYSNNVNSVVSSSNQTGSSLFGILQSGVSSSNATSVQQQINRARQSAQNQLQRARAFSVPDPDKGAQTYLLLALRMRLDGITNIASEIQPALGSSVNHDAINHIAAEMARFYSSDVVYKQYAAPALVSALHANNIAVGGADGQPINGGQFLPSIQWLDPNHVASVLNVNLGSGHGGKPSPGLHGHTLNTVSAGGSQLQSGATNSVAASPPPTFTLSFTNGGQHNERDVRCKVTVTGTGVTGTKVVPQTTAGQNATCDVRLSQSPPTGTYNVVATVEKVPGETNTANNSLTFPVTFH